MIIYCTYISQKLFLNRIQPSLWILRNDLEVVVDDHLAEKAAFSQQHDQVTIDAVAEGQHDDIRCELKKKVFLNLSYFLKSANIVNVVNKFLLVGVVVSNVGQPDVHLAELWVRIQTSRRRRTKSVRWFPDIPAPSVCSLVMIF